MILLNKSKFWCVFAWNRALCNHVNVTSTLTNVYILELGERDKGVIMNLQWFRKKYFIFTFNKVICIYAYYALIFNKTAGLLN